jgi:polar amino acid transport system ATP-binding protein
MEDLATRGMTMITVTHEMGFARKVANQVVFMHRGKILALPAALARLKDLSSLPGRARTKRFHGEVQSV